MCVVYKCALTGVYRESKPSFGIRRLGFCAGRLAKPIHLCRPSQYYVKLSGHAWSLRGYYLPGAWLSSQFAEVFDVDGLWGPLRFLGRLSSSAVKLFHLLTVSIGLWLIRSGWWGPGGFFLLRDGVHTSSRTRVRPFFVAWGSHCLDLFFDRLISCYDRLWVSGHRGDDLARHSKFLCLI